MNSLDSVKFISLMKAGHAWLRQHVETVNALNVFPVPDGDTGTNMELSLASGVQMLSVEVPVSLQTAIQTLNRGLLMGARGNSGVILSQLFRGFTKLDPAKSVMSVHDFAVAMNEGVQVAYKAVSKPVEGTILTVAKDAAMTAQRESRNTADFEQFFTRVHEAACESLTRTPLMLPVLREAGVVDSGGQGLVYVLEGFLRFVRGESVVDSSEPTGRISPPRALRASSQPERFAEFASDHQGEFGYCTEVLVRVNDTSVESEATLRKTLSVHGDSMLVVQVDDLIKVHIHTLHPGRVLEDALRVGPLIRIKIENMTEQNAALHEDAYHHVANDAADATDVTTDVAEHVQTRDVAVVAVVSGEGLKEVFRSVGADVVVDGGTTMNPCTEDIVTAMERTRAKHIILLPNHKNVRPSAEQAKNLVDAEVYVIGTENFPEGLAAMMAFNANRTPNDNAVAMDNAIQGVVCGQVARASRNAVFQNQEILEGQYLGLRGHDLCSVADSRDGAAMAVLEAIAGKDAELMTVFYGESVPESEALAFAKIIEQRFEIEVECRSGGQPIYDYIFSVE